MCNSLIRKKCNHFGKRNTLLDNNELFSDSALISAYVIDQLTSISVSVSTKHHLLSDSLSPVLHCALR